MDFNEIADACLPVQYRQLDCQFSLVGTMKGGIFNHEPFSLSPFVVGSSSRLVGGGQDLAVWLCCHSAGITLLEEVVQHGIEQGATIEKTYEGSACSPSLNLYTYTVKPPLSGQCGPRECL